MGCSGEGTDDSKTWQSTAGQPPTANIMKQPAIRGMSFLHCGSISCDRLHGTAQFADPLASRKEMNAMIHDQNGKMQKRKIATKKGFEHALGLNV